MTKSLIIDLDKTLIRLNSQKLFIRYLRMNNAIDKYNYYRIICIVILYKLKLLGARFAMKQAYQLLDGRSVSEVDRLMDDFFKKDIMGNFNQEITELVHGAQMDGDQLILLSNSIQPIVKRVAFYLKIDEYYGSELEIVNGKYTGKILSTYYGNEKRKLFDRIRKRDATKNLQYFAYSDSCSDLPLLRAVDYPVTVNADFFLRLYARVNKWNMIKCSR